GSALNTRMTFENLPKAQDQRILICTNEFHQRRSVALARGFGFQAWAYGRDRTTYKSAPLLFLRERLSRVKWLLETL
ncbi:MAG: YdcF family protein, partial [Bdellovibrionales bacterium]|nr:YdcF family protein [Bdellovibrionales bacterium]